MEQHPHATKFMQTAHGVSRHASCGATRRLDARARRRASTRRVTSLTPMEIAGPARGHPLMRTRADPAGHARHRHLRELLGRQDALGHLSHLAKKTSTTISPGRAACMRRRPGPGAGRRHAPLPVSREQLLRLGSPGSRASTCASEPNEPLRFGWMVEIDPHDPQLRAAQAHRARPLPARGRQHHRRQDRPRRRLHG